MSATQGQHAQALLSQMGVTKISVKVGSIWMPLLLIALVAVGFLAVTVVEDRKTIGREFAKICDITPEIAKKRTEERKKAFLARTPALKRMAEQAAELAAKDPGNASKQANARRAASILATNADNAIDPGPNFKQGLLKECEAFAPSTLDKVSPGEAPEQAKVVFLKSIRDKLEQKPTLKAMLDEFPSDLEHLGGWKRIFVQGRAFAKTYFANLTDAFKQYAGSVVKVVGTALILSVLPGLAGLIYRRAFRSWFLVSFVILLAVISVLEGERVPAGAETVKPSDYAREAGTLFVLLVSQTVLLLLSHRLRRYTSSVTSFIPTGIYNKVLGLVLFAAAVAMGLFGLGKEIWEYLAPEDWLLQVLYRWEFILIILPLIYTLLRQSGLWTTHEPKNIVVCLDGTNNTPEQFEFGRVAHTNVYKLFRLLKSDVPQRTFPDGAFGASLCKTYGDKQIAFYYVGVGNQFENDPIGQVLGQAMGLGASGVVDRAYLDVMRVYEPGDKVHIFGFSRGAAIARLLARALDHRGNPRSVWTIRLFGRHWTVWKSKPAAGKDGRIPIAVLGCWDTVGAFGLAKKIAGIDFQKIDLFKDLSIPNNVEQAYHMVALDEERDSFVPTLMDPDPINPGRIVEVWFSGDHANVGGGWATPKLSDITLDFLLKHVSSGYAHEPGMAAGKDEWGLCLDAVNVSSLAKDDPARLLPNAVDPDHLGQLRHWSSMLYKYTPRKLPVHAVIYDKVFERMTQSEPVYAPQSLFDLNEELDKKRSSVGKAVERLLETRSLNEDEHSRIVGYMEKLQLTRWSRYVKELQDLNVAPTPVKELTLRKTTDVSTLAPVRQLAAAE